MKKVKGCMYNGQMLPSGTHIHRALGCLRSLFFLLTEAMHGHQAEVDPKPNTPGCLFFFPQDKSLSLPCYSHFTMVLSKLALNLL